MVTKIDYAKIDDLHLDPLNYRLGHSNTEPNLSEDKILELMKDWVLDELAISFLENGGFWTHEALLAVKEKPYGKYCLVVVEGNRRLAALKYLYNALNGNPASAKWAEIAKSATPPTDLFEKIPYRDEIEARN